MEGRGGRARGGQWRRGGGGGAQDTVASGERRGRGRGGHHRGRGRRDHYRGRGRGGGGGGAGGGADFFSRMHSSLKYNNQSQIDAVANITIELNSKEEVGQDEQDNKENLEEEMPDIYSRRKLESNWDRYEESEKEEVNDGIPVQRGTDYHVLLSSAGDSFTQFRFSEEKDWEMDSLAVNQVPVLSVDLEALAQSLQELPLHKRLNIEADLVQVTTPVELPSVGVLHKVDANVIGGFKASAPPYMSREPALGGSCPVKPAVRTSTSPQASAAVTSPEDDADGELDLLLGIHKPLTELSIAEPRTSNPAEEPASPEKVEEKKEEVVEVNQLKAEKEAERKKAEEVKPESASVKQEMTEEDLEDWLDSMIS